MIILRGLILYFMFAFGKGENKYKTPRIIDGKNASPGEIPFQVSLRAARTAHHFCGGVIINEEYVVTAAHCIVKDDISKQLLKDNIKIATGIYISKPLSSHSVTNIYVHENYNYSDSLVNDLALLRVSPLFKFNKFISPVALPPPDLEILQRQRATVSGFGTTTYPSRSAPDRLQKTEVKLINQGRCRKLYKEVSRNIYPGQICSFHVNSTQDACKGDSGGPLFIDNVLIGIVSWSRKKATDCSGMPQVYTRVSKYVGWIRKHTA